MEEQAAALVSRRLQQDQRQLARQGLRAHVRQERALRSALRPDALSLVALRHNRGRAKALAFYLDLDVWVRDEVEVPVRMLGATVARGEDYVALAVAQVHQGVRVR